MGLDISHYIPSKEKQLDFFTKNDLMIHPSYVKNNRYLFVTDEDGNEVLYLEEIGYQRKAMSNDFYNIFINNRPYFKLENVLKAQSFLDADGDKSLDQLRESFSKNFIDNFIEGKSIFAASW